MKLKKYEYLDQKTSSYILTNKIMELRKNKPYMYKSFVLMLNELYVVLDAVADVIQ